MFHFTTSANRKQLSSFLGLASYFRKYIPAHAHITACLTDTLKGMCRLTFKWSVEAYKAFLALKSCLASHSVLRPHDFNRPFAISVDASDVAIGACLFQVYDG